MPRKKLKYVQAFEDRHGARRYYFRRPGFPRVPLPGPYGGPEFLHAYDVALAGAPAVVGTSRSPVGSLSALIAAYYASGKFEKLRQDSTAVAYRRILEKLREEHGHRPVAGMQPKHVAALVDAQNGPHARKRLLNLLSILMRHAIRLGWRQDNPARDIEVDVPVTEGRLTWSESEIAQFRAHWPLGTVPRLVLELGLNTGQRRGDLVRMGRDSVRDGKIWISQGKTGQPVAIPIIPELVAALAIPPCRNLGGPFLQTGDGKPRSAAGLGNDFRDWVREAGLERPLTLHGFRKALTVRLVRAGCTAPEIMAIGGWRSLAAVQKYIAEFDRENAAESGFEKLNDRFGGPKK